MEVFQQNFRVFPCKTVGATEKKKKGRAEFSKSDSTLPKSRSGSAPEYVIYEFHWKKFVPAIKSSFDPVSNISNQQQVELANRNTPSSTTLYNNESQSKERKPHFI